MQAKKSEADVMQEIIAKLAAEGIEASIETRKDADDLPEIEWLRVPSWENSEGGLCRKAVYAFLHSKLASQPGKGFVASSPLSTNVDVYCYYPPSVEQEGRELSCWDIMVWGVGAGLENFKWEELVEGDDSAWWDGWDMMPEFDYLDKRVANLWNLLNYQIIDMPAVPPLTHSELVGILKDSTTRDELFCHGPDYKDRWSLRLAENDQLVVHSALQNTVTPITEANFDKGRVVLDGRVLMHRCFGF